MARPWPCSITCHDTTTVVPPRLAAAEAELAKARAQHELMSQLLG